MANLGDHVIYQTDPVHHTKTVKHPMGDPAAPVVELEGSVHHPEMREFAGIVGRVNDDGTHDLLIHVPNQPSRWVNGCKESANFNVVGARGFGKHKSAA